MAAKNKVFGCEAQFYCPHCHQSFGKEVTICPNCKRDLTASETWPPSVLRPFHPSGASHTAPSPKRFWSVLLGIGMGVCAYIVTLIALWMGGEELSKRYMPPYPGSVGLIMWVMLLTLPLLPVWLFASRCRGIKPEMLLGVKLGATFGLLLAVTLLLLLFHNMDWRQELGY